MRAAVVLRTACCVAGLGMIAAGLLEARLGFDLVEQLPSFPICWVRWLCDLPCPGCGMLRGLLRVGQLDFATASALHPLSLPCAAAIAWIAAGSPGHRCLQALPQAVRGPAVALSILVVLSLWALRIVNGSAV